MKRSTMPSAARTLAVAATATGLVVLGATAASAHVTVTPSTTDAGAYSLLTFSVPHGCDGSPTTKVSIQVPEQFVTVTPTVNPGWDVTKTMEKLDTPVDNGHGGEYTERVAEVVYTAKTPLPDGYRDALDIQVKLPEDADETISFPVVQTCEKGETAWVEIPEEGKDEPEAPAPTFVTTTAAATEDGAASDDASDKADDTAEGSDTEQAADSEETTAASEDDGSDVLPWVGVGLGAAGLVLGGIAFARTRRPQA